MNLTKSQSNTIKKLASDGELAYGAVPWSDKDGAIYIDCKDGIAYINKDGAIQWQR